MLNIMLYILFIYPYALILLIISLMFVHASNFTYVNGQFFFLFELPVGIGEHDSFGPSEFIYVGQINI